MRASTEKLKVSLKGVGGREKGGGGWMATPKTPKTKKIAQDVHTSERATLRNFLKKAKNKHEGFYTPFLLVALRFSMRARGFYYCCCLFVV